MAENKLKTLETLDPELLSMVQEAQAFAFSDGALPQKVKFLIAVALDAAHGKYDGVNQLTRLAMGAGATKQEIAEALRVAYYLSGAGSAFTASIGLKDTFQADI